MVHENFPPELEHCGGSFTGLLPVDIVDTLVTLVSKVSKVSRMHLVSSAG